MICAQVGQSVLSASSSLPDGCTCRGISRDVAVCLNCECRDVGCIRPPQGYIARGVDDDVTVDLNNQVGTRMSAGVTVPDRTATSVGDEVAIGLHHEHGLPVGGHDVLVGVELLTGGQAVAALEDSGGSDTVP